jgi:hypothetical protein
VVGTRRFQTLTRSTLYILGIADKDKVAGRSNSETT